MQSRSNDGKLYIAGQRVPPGSYKQVDDWRVVHLDHEDFLPASLDGRVACYVPEPLTWGQLLHGLSPENTLLNREKNP